MFILEDDKGNTIELLENNGTLPSGWKIKAFIPDSIQRRKETIAGIAIWATKFGLPVASFLTTARWLLQKDCPFCESGTKILQSIKELGEKRAHEALVRIFEAKERNDLAALAEIRKSLWSSESQESPPQS